MRISDWSSDVCPSDLNRRLEQLTSQVEALKGQNQAMQADGQRVLSAYQSENEQLRRQANERRTPAPTPGPGALYGPTGPQAYQRPDGAATRSEEHTSELQSLMRISYAVFCLKKNTKQQHKTSHPYQT